MFFISFGQFYCSKMSDLYAKVLTGADNHSPHEFRLKQTKNENKKSKKKHSFLESLVQHRISSNSIEHSVVNLAKKIVE